MHVKYTISPKDIDLIYCRMEFCISFDSGLVHTHYYLLTEKIPSGTSDYFGLCSEESENEDHDEDMDADAANQGDEVAHALAAADALGKGSKSTSSKSNFEDITDGLRELDMEHYDEEDNGNRLSYFFTTIK